MCLGACIQKVIEANEKSLEPICNLKSLELSINDFVINRYKQLLKQRKD